MDFVYNDYASWKLDNDELIKALIATPIVVRFKHVYDVTEFIYDKAVNHKDINKDEIDIFQYGFDYLFDQFEILGMLWNTEFDNNIEEMIKNSKSINFLLYVIDFTREIEDSKILEKFQNLEEKAFEFIKKKELIPDELFGILNDLVFKAFPEGNYKGVIEIFLDIADELGISYLEEDVYTINK